MQVSAALCMGYGIWDSVVGWLAWYFGFGEEGIGRGCSFFGEPIASGWAELVVGGWCWCWVVLHAALSRPLSLSRCALPSCSAVK